jgi:hypothetical protein
MELLIHLNQTLRGKKFNTHLENMPTWPISLIKARKQVQYSFGKYANLANLSYQSVSLKVGMQKFRVPGRHIDHILYNDAQYLKVLRVEPASCHPGGSWCTAVLVVHRIGSIVCSLTTALILNKRGHTKSDGLNFDV